MIPAHGYDERTVYLRFTSCDGFCFDICPACPYTVLSLFHAEIIGDNVSTRHQGGKRVSSERLHKRAVPW